LLKNRLSAIRIEAEIGAGLQTPPKWPTEGLLFHFQQGWRRTDRSKESASTTVTCLFLALLVKSGIQLDFRQSAKIDC